MYPGLYARSKPNEPAAIAATSGEQLSWQELDERSNRLARLLHAMGLRRGDNFAVMLENHLRYFEVAWAALRSGLYLTAVNRYLTTEEAGYIVNDSGARLLVTSKRLAAVAEGLQAHAPRCERWMMIDGAEPGYEAYEEAIAGYPAEALSDEPGGGFMLYSSGTTGRPKGIKRPLPEGSVRDEPVLPIVELMKGLWDFSPDTVYLSPAPLYHSAPLAFTTMAQSIGGTVIMMERFDALAALECIERYRVTHTQWVPTMFSRMLKLPEADRTRAESMSIGRTKGRKGGIRKYGRPAARAWEMVRHRGRATEAVR
ncbi:MAG: AMP-binding protein [Acidobacteriota bacterium]